MGNSIQIINNKWIKASVLAGLWAGVEIIAGSFLHNLRIPLSGTFLTLISIVLVIGFFQIWPIHGIIWRAGVITALMKSISPSSVILGPMIAITMEGFIMELTVRIAGRNISGYLMAGMFTMIGILVHKVIRLFLLFGLDIFKIYEEMFIFATKKLGLIQVNPARAVLILFSLYALLGLLAAFFGYRLGKRAKYEQHHERFEYATSSNNEIWNQPKNEIAYSTNYLILLILTIPLLLFYLNKLDLYHSLLLSAPWFFFIFWRYRYAMRQLKKWLFWIQLLMILVLAWFFSKTPVGGVQGKLIALSGGVIMILRALVVVTGFAAISTELRAPLMQQLFFRSGFRQLYLSVNHAFGILPMVVGALTTPRKFISHPFKSISDSLKHVDNWHVQLLRLLNDKEDS